MQVIFRTDFFKMLCASIMLSDNKTPEQDNTLAELYT